MKGYTGYILISRKQKQKQQYFRFVFIFTLLILSHCSSELSLYFQTGASLQQRADGWKEKVMGTRGLRPRTPTYLNQETQVVAYCA